ncbi:MAG: hypothetical protein H7Y37_19630 [Anaerolineae bacterium]|nr:hypothetical protein [Gloeobacterales cyanobacterium ES-bin-313]
MRQKMSVRLVLMISATLITAFQSALAQFDSPPPDAKMENLTPEQRTKMRKAFQECQEKAGQDREAFRSCMDEKVQEIVKPKSKELS